MIAYFAYAPSEMMVTVLHKLRYHHDAPCVLFISSRFYASKGLLYLREELENHGIFNKVVGAPTICSRNIPLNLPDEEVEQKIITYFDELLQSCGYSPNDFEKIYTVLDDWDSDIAAYLNLKKIHYTWIQPAKNWLLPVNPSARGYYRVFSKLKSTSPSAEYADACFRADSDIPSEFKGKSYSTWDHEDALTKLSAEDTEKLVQCYHIDKSILEPLKTKEKNTTLILQSSYGVLRRDSRYVHEKSKTFMNLGFAEYTPTEIFSCMDKLMVDFFAPQTDSLYLKMHIHEYGIVPAELVFRAYGNDVILMPNVHFQILGKYLEEKELRFNTLLASSSSSISNSLGSSFEKEFILGADFNYTWYFYLSICAAVLFADFAGFETISAAGAMASQVSRIAESIHCEVLVEKYDGKKFYQSKNTLFLMDLRFDLSPNLMPEKMDKSSAAAFLNAELSDDFLPEGCAEGLTPIRLKKDKIGSVPCDILFREETVWFYAPAPEIRKSARDFTFEKELKFCGMRVHTDSITYPETLRVVEDTFRSRLLETKLRRMNTRIRLLESYIQGSAQLISNLKETQDMDEYLGILKLIKNDYVLLLAVKDTPGDCLNPTEMEAIHALGFSDFTKDLWTMYAGMTGKGHVIANRRGANREDPVEVQYVDMNSGTEYVVRSQAWKKGNKAEILINGQDYAANIRGINIVVYDPESRTVIDSIGFDHHEPRSRFVRKS